MIIIISIVLVSYFTVTFFIPAYLHRQPDYLGLILYNCAMGFERYGHLDMDMRKDPILIDTM